MVAATNVQSPLHSHRTRRLLCPGCPSEIADDPLSISSSPSIPEDASGHFVNKTRLFLSNHMRS